MFPRRVDSGKAAGLGHKPAGLAIQLPGLLAACLLGSMLAWPPTLRGESAAETQPTTQRSQTDSAATTPREVVARLHETLIDVMKAGESASFEARYERLEPVVLESFHLPLIARLVLAGHWQRLSESEQETFVQLMGRLTTATYAARFDGYDGHRFETYADQAQRRGLHVVRARFGKPKGETRQFDYQLRETRDGWRIINVAVDGVSDLSLKRAQYQEVVDKHGFKELLKRLRDKVADLADPGTEEQDDG